MMRTIFLCLLSASLCAQVASPFEGFEPAQDPNSSLRVCFYNVENLFDTFDDTLTIDEEFLPEGKKQWDSFKYWEKQKNMAKTLLAVGSDYAPSIIGLCEVENRRVLDDLVNLDIMKPHDYRVVHFESTDRRGIDVGLLVKREDFKVLSASFIRLNKEDDPNWRTRDILYVKAANQKWVDTLHIFVNHWPSRRGGEEASRPLRLIAANALKQRVDSIQGHRSDAKIVIMGDLNDGVGDASLVEGLQTVEQKDIESNELVDMMSSLDSKLGTHKYRGEWAYLDHFVLSGSLLSEGSASYVEGVKVFRADWLLKPDDRYTGQYPKRTYSGPRYLGGYSDHLPIYFDLKRSNL